MKNVILVAVTFLFSIQAFADLTHRPVTEAKCLTEAAQEIVKYLRNDGLKYNVTIDQDGLASRLIPAPGIEETAYSASWVYKYDDQEEIFYTADQANEAKYAIFQITANECKLVSVGTAQDDGD